jgi:hypothetical protein
MTMHPGCQQPTRRLIDGLKAFRASNGRGNEFKINRAQILFPLLCDKFACGINRRNLTPATELPHGKSFLRASDEIVASCRDTSPRAAQAALSANDNRRSACVLKTTATPSVSYAPHETARFLALLKNRGPSALP